MAPLHSTEPDLSIVVPAHNEAGNVAALLARLRDALGPLLRWELVVVDDGSTDGTLGVVKRLAEDEPRVRFVALARNFGHQAALRAGLRHARGAGVVVMDADLEHPPELVPRLIAEWRAGAKIVLTERDSGAVRQSVVKRISSRSYYRVLNAIGDIRIEPGSADFMLLDRAVVDTINGLEAQDLFLRGLVRWLGYPIARVTYAQGNRQSGETKYSLRKMLSFGLTGIVAHSIKPLRVAIYLSLIFVVIGLLLLAYSLVSFLWIGHTVAGWTSILSAMSILGAGQFLVLGIIGEYIGRILRETRRWPTYIIAETEQSGGERNRGVEPSLPAVESAATAASAPVEIRSGLSSRR